MVLLLEFVEGLGLYQMLPSLPLQLGEVDIFFVLLVGVGFAAVVIGIIVFALRRTAALSDEYSKEAKAKFDAIKPGGAHLEEKAAQNRQNPFMDSTRYKIPPPAGTAQREETPRPKPQTQFTESRPPDPSASALRAELQDTRNRLQQYVREALKEREATRNEMEAVRAEVRTLRQKLIASSLELQKLRGSLEQQNLQLQSQKRVMDMQRQEVKQAVEQPAQIQQETHEKGVSRIFDIFRRRPCPYCGRQLEPQATYCDTCGQRVVSTIPGR
jgi:DNA repair exonuclease SbcCD ATPase subunit